MDDISLRGSVLIIYGFVCIISGKIHVLYWQGHATFSAEEGGSLFYVLCLVMIGFGVLISSF